MPAIRLTEDATEMLKNYYWNGNVRQLKNVAEQISIIENAREITAETLYKYLPAHEMHSGLALLGSHSQTSRDNYMNERELLYKVLFDMKRDMTEMRQQLNGLLSTAASTHCSGEVMMSNHAAYEPVEEVEDTTAHTPTSVPTEDVEVLPTNSSHSTMEDIERETIRCALERNKGSRKITASELHISERTLYRKIKEYGL
jgi:DNA-binding NtrC family response regulator